MSMKMEYGLKTANHTPHLPIAKRQLNILSAFRDQFWPGSTAKRSAAQRLSSSELVPGALLQPLLPALDARR